MVNPTLYQYEKIDRRHIGSESYEAVTRTTICGDANTTIGTKKIPSNLYNQSILSHVRSPRISPSIAEQTYIKVRSGKKSAAFSASEGFT